MADRALQSPSTEDLESSSPEPGSTMLAGERHLRQLAAAAGYPSLAKVAQVAPCDRHTIIAACRGSKKPMPDVVARLARALRVDAALLETVFAAARAARRGRR